jgi:hypothetical protein
MLLYEFESAGNIKSLIYLEHRRRYNTRRKTPIYPSLYKIQHQEVKPKPDKPIIAKPQKHFPQFPRLPQEIRLKIWDMVTDEPRAVIIHSRLGPGGGIRSPTPVPSALHVCLESREVALKKYELTFSARDARLDSNYLARIWFNFDKDVVYFRNHGENGWGNLGNFQSLVITEDMEKIKFLGIDIEVDNSPMFCFFREPLPNWITPYRVTCFQKWTGLEAVFRSNENSRVKTNKALMVYALRRNKERLFVRQYRQIFGKDGRFKGLSLSAAVERIKREAMTSAGFHGIGTAEVRLATISNS